MSDGSSGSRRLASFGRPWARNRPRRTFLVTSLEALEGRRLLSSSGDRAAALAARPLIQPAAQQTDVPDATGAHDARAASRGPIDATKGQGGDPALVGSWMPPT